MLDIVHIVVCMHIVGFTMLRIAFGLMLCLLFFVAV